MEVKGAQSIRVEPFLKWAGGKRWLASNHLDIFPSTYKRYVEPFLGSGAVFFALNPCRGILSDRNSTLIETYQAIRDDWRKVQYELQRHHGKHCTEYYYSERSRRRRSAHGKAAQFIYLNRTCWNGLYRVNKKGEFNVPIGTKSSVCLPSDNFEETARRLRNMKLTASDFEDTINRSKENDFVFVDPPYTVKHNMNGFVKYNESIFTWDDQLRLRDCLSRAESRGVKVLLTNADHESVRELYRGIGRTYSVPRKSVLAASASRRGITTELLIAINYRLSHDPIYTSR